MASKMIVRVADLRQQVYDSLKERITAGAFPPDAKFQELSIAEDMGVSRTPVREALAMLVRDGLLEQGRRGFRYPRLSAEFVADVTDVRLRLEPYALRRVVERLDAGARKRLAALIRRETSGAGGSDDYIAAHRRIRAAIFDVVGNDVLTSAIQQFEDAIHQMRISTLSEQRWRDISVQGHAALAQALEDGDADAAAAAQESLLINARSAFLDYLERQEAGEAE